MTPTDATAQNDPDFLSGYLHEVAESIRAGLPLTAQDADMVARASTLLAAGLAAGAVPMEPTPAMLDAGTIVFNRIQKHMVPRWEPAIAAQFWRAMYDAAPRAEPPKAER